MTELADVFTACWQKLLDRGTTFSQVRYSESRSKACAACNHLAVQFVDCREPVGRPFVEQGQRRNDPAAGKKVANGRTGRWQVDIKHGYLGWGVGANLT